MYNPVNQENSIRMKKDFENSFTAMLNQFMETWGEYIDDSSDIDRLITDAFDEYVINSEYFED